MCLLPWTLNHFLPCQVGCQKRNFRQYLASEKSRFSFHFPQQHRKCELVCVCVRVGGWHNHIFSHPFQPPTLFPTLFPSLLTYKTVLEPCWRLEKYPKFGETPQNPHRPSSVRIILEDSSTSEITHTHSQSTLTHVTPSQFALINAFVGEQEKSVDFSLALGFPFTFFLFLLFFLSIPTMTTATWHTRRRNRTLSSGLAGTHKRDDGENLHSLSLQWCRSRAWEREQSFFEREFSYAKNVSYVV